MKFCSIFLSLFVAGILAAQPAPRQHGALGRPMMQNLTADLNLTADQQSQAKAIFQDHGAQSKDLAAKLRDQRAALTAAVKSGSTDQIDKITQDMSGLQAQMAAIRAKSLAKFYALLTPDQKAKVDQKLDRMLQYGPHRPRVASQGSGQ
ncbi:MAG: hypothetical protein DMG59_16310 [Acidobacteria bacterium]|jgi:Spy/CpxP family protein refolding chaperone|nr:MAG: hypothetical protein DMG59_16310 [Acidobacteriota bacterium]